MHSVEEVLALEKETDGIFHRWRFSCVYQEFYHFVRYYTGQSSIMYLMEMLIFHLLTGV